MLNTNEWVMKLFITTFDESCDMYKNYLSLHYYDYVPV